MRLLGPCVNWEISSWGDILEFPFDGIKLDAQPQAVVGSRMGVELTIANENDTPARIHSSQLGFVLLTERFEGATSPSDGPSTAVDQELSEEHLPVSSGLHWCAS